LWKAVLGERTRREEGNLTTEEGTDDQKMDGRTWYGEARLGNMSRDLYRQLESGGRR